MKCSSWPQRKNMKRQTETVTRGFNRPLNQFAQHQDKTRMYNFLRWRPPLPPLPALSSASLPRLSWLDSVHSVSQFFLSTFLCHAAGNELTESKWGSEEDKVSTIWGIYCSQQSRGRCIPVASQMQLFPVQNNFHILRTENEKNECTASSLAVNYPSSRQDLSSRSELQPTCTPFSSCLGWRSPSKVFALISAPPRFRSHNCILLQRGHLTNAMRSWSPATCQFLTR